MIQQKMSVSAAVSIAFFVVTAEKSDEAVDEVDRRKNNENGGVEDELEGIPDESPDVPPGSVTMGISGDHGIEDGCLATTEELLEDVPGGQHDLEIPLLPVEPPVHAAILITVTSFTFRTVATGSRSLLTSWRLRAIRRSFHATLLFLGRSDRVGVKCVDEELDGPGDPSENTGEHAERNVSVDDVAKLLADGSFGLFVRLLEESRAIAGDIVHHHLSRAV